jgi:hypothetical protein
MASIKEWDKVRDKLGEIKEMIKDSEDVDMRNLVIVLDLISLCTYMPDEIEPLYYIVDEHMDNILGGNN